jgi:hypothetical protein
MTRERLSSQVRTLSEHTPSFSVNSPRCPSKSFSLYRYLAGTEASPRGHSSTILGRAIKTEYLVLTTLFSTVGLSYAAASGGSKSAPSGSKQTLQEVKGAVKFDSSSK